MDLSRHITELFYTHDCVIVPGLGGFILREIPGRRQAGTGQFAPPSREVSFNGLLKDDDGVLTASLAAEQGIPYEEARAQVAGFVRDLTGLLDTGREATLEGIGTLGYSTDLRLVFKPSPGLNFLESSFGLSPIVAHPHHTSRRPPRPERLAKARTDRKPAKADLKTPAPVKWSVAVSVPVILFLLWGILFPASFQHTYVNYSGMLSDLFVTESPAVSIPANTVTETPAAQPMETSTEPAVTETEPVATVLNYHVIAGVFRSPENAERYASSLADRGFASSLVGTDKAGRYRVSFGSFASQPAADEYLEYIRTHENPAAWVLYY